MQSTFAVSTLLLISLSFSINAWSEIYQWTDENGQTHFGDRAPSQTVAKEISSQVDQINITSELSSPEMMLRHEQAKDAEREQHYKDWQEQQENKPDKSEKCKELKELLQIVKGRVVFVDEQGKDLKISETVRKQRASELEDGIRQYCQ